MTDSAVPAMQAWHQLVRSPDRETLRSLLSDDIVFRSPAMHKPKHGRDQAEAFLWAALTVLAPTLHYDHEWIDRDDNSAVLLFTAEVGGREVNGVDIVRWGPDNRFTDFTVMIRPLQALQAVIVAIGEQLEAAE